MVSNREFKIKAYELAFGEGAYENGYTEEEVFEALQNHVQELYSFKEAIETLLENAGENSEMSEDDFEYYERVLKDIQSFRDGTLLTSIEEEDEE